MEAWRGQESPSLEQNQESMGQRFQVLQEIHVLVVELYSRAVQMEMLPVGHCLEPNLSNPQVSPEVTHPVKEMEKEVLMEREIVEYQGEQEEVLLDQEVQLVE